MKAMRGSPHWDNDSIEKSLTPEALTAMVASRGHLALALEADVRDGSGQPRKWLDPSYIMMRGSGLPRPLPDLLTNPAKRGCRKAEKNPKASTAPR